MRAQGVNRVTIGVKDTDRLDEAVEFYSKLLGATFYDQSIPAEPFNLKCFISWDAGIELVAPLPGRDSIAEKYIAEHGEGLIGVVFAVDDVEECRGNGEYMGVRFYPFIDWNQDEIDKYLQGRFRKYTEYQLSPADTYGVGPVVGQIEPK